MSLLIGGVILVNLMTLIGGLFFIGKMLTGPIDKRIDGLDKRIDRLEDSFKTELKEIKANQARIEKEVREKFEKILEILHRKDK